MEGERKRITIVELVHFHFSAYDYSLHVLSSKDPVVSCIAISVHDDSLVCSPGMQFFFFFFSNLALDCFILMLLIAKISRSYYASPSNPMRNITDLTSRLAQRTLDEREDGFDNDCFDESERG